MSNKREIKKDINYVLGDIIGIVTEWQSAHKDKAMDESEAIIDDTITVFDDLIARVNNKSVDNKKQHFKTISADLEEKGRALIERINALS